MHVENPGAEAARGRISPCGRDQLVQQHRIDSRVVVQHQHVFGVAVERIANAEVVAPAVSEIPARLDDLDVRRSCRTTERGERSVARAVVNDDDPAPDVVQISQRLHASDGVGRPVPVQHNNPDQGNTRHRRGDSIADILDRVDNANPLNRLASLARTDQCEGAIGRVATKANPQVAAPASTFIRVIVEI